MTENSVSCVINASTVKYLNERLSLLEQSRSAKEIVSFTAEIAKIVESSNFEKNKSIDLISRKIEELEDDLVESSYSSKETKEIEYYINSLKKEKLLSLEQVERESRVNSLRVEKNKQFIRLNQIRNEISEVQNAICISGVIILSREHGIEISPDQVVQNSLKIKENDYNICRRKHNREIKLLETNLSIQISYFRNQEACVIFGIHDSVLQARDKLMDLITWSSILLPYGSEHITVLLARKGFYCHYFESQTHTLIHIDRQNNQITAEGGTHSLEILQKQLDDFYSHTLSMLLPSAVIMRLRANNHELLTEMMDNCPGFFRIDFNTRELVIYGLKEDLLKSEIFVNDMIDRLTDKSIFIAIPDALHVAYIVGSKGVGARRLERDTRCRCKFSSRNEVPGVTVTGCAAEVAAAGRFIEMRLAAYDHENLTMELPELAMPVLLNAKAAQLRAIQIATHTHITVMKETQQLVIRGDESNVTAASEQLQSLLSDIVTWSTPLSPLLRGRFLGPRGAHVEQIRRHHSVSVRFDGDVLVLQGLRHSVDSAREYVEKWLKDWHVATVSGSAEAVAKVVIGPRGSVVRLLEKSLGVRLTQHGSDGDIIILGDAVHVAAAQTDLQHRIDAFTASHHTFVFSQLLFTYCPDLSRGAFAALRSQFPQCTITVAMDSLQVRCEGDTQEMQQLTSYFTCLSTQYAHHTLRTMSLPSHLCGLVIGKDGRRVKQLQTEWSVTLTVNRTAETLSAWGEESAVDGVLQAVNRLVEENETVVEEVEMTRETLSALLVDRCRGLAWIQADTHVNVVLPKTQTAGLPMSVTLSGPRRCVITAMVNLRSAMNGIYTYVYSYAADAVMALVASDTIHFDRISLATQSFIVTDSRGNITIRGKASAIHAAHVQLFAGLSSLFPARFRQTTLTDGVCHILTTGSVRPSLDEVGRVCAVPAEHAVYMYGNDLDATYEAVQRRCEALAAENVIVLVESEFVPHVIGSKGRKIKEIALSAGAAVEILPSNDSVYIHGNKENVATAVSLVNGIVMEFRDLNVMIRTTTNIMSLFITQYGDLLKEWEMMYGGRVFVDMPHACIRVKGETAKGTLDLKYTIESMLEAVELKEETELAVYSHISVSAISADGDEEDIVLDTPRRDDVGEEGSDSQHRLQLESLLGISGII